MNVRLSSRKIPLRRGLSFAGLFFFVLCPLIGQERPRIQRAINPAEQRYQAAQTFQLASDFDKAAVEYKAAIAYALQQIGNLHLAREEWSKAADLLSRAIKMDPANAPARIDLAVAQYQAGEIEPAKAMIEDTLRQNPSDVRALVLAGKVYFMQADYAKAAERFETALQLQPNFDIGYMLALTDLELKKTVPANVIFDEMLATSKPDASIWVLIGIAYRETGYLDRAAVHFAKAIQLDPRKHNVHAALGVTRFLQGPEHDKEARQFFESELTLDAKDYTSLYFLGLIEARHHNAREAQQWLTQAVAARPQSLEARLALGKAELELDDNEQAAKVLKEGVQTAGSPLTDSDTAELHEQLAEALNRLGQKDEASKEIAEAKKIRSGTPQRERKAVPSNELQHVLRTVPQKEESFSEKQREYIGSLSALLGEAYDNLGVIDARAERYAVASEEFAQAAHWNPSIQRLDRNWGIAAFRAEQYAQATEPLARELAKNPKDATLRQMLGVSYYMTDQVAKSAETFRPILDELPENPGVRYSAGVALIRSGDYIAGKKILSALLEKNASSPELHLIIAQAYSDQSRFDEALSELQRALALNPQLAQAHYALGMVYFKQGKLEEAVEEFNREFSRDHDAVASEYQIAYIKLQQNRPFDAIPLLNDVLKHNPQNADGHYQLGKALLETGDTAGAIDHLETALQLQPAQAYGYYQLSLAYRRAGRLEDADEALQEFQKLKDAKAGKLAGSPTGSF
jgi:tetratricopeptide (TPR) repeat protein